MYPETNTDTKNDGLDKMYLRLQIWRHFGVSMLVFGGVYIP